MTFEKGKAKTGGRQLGTPNALTGAFRDAVRIAFTGLGGHENFLAWAKNNQTEFYRIAARLIPGEMQRAERETPLTIIVQREQPQLVRDARLVQRAHTEETQEG